MKPSWVFGFSLMLWLSGIGCGDASSSGATFECGGTSVASRPRCAITTEYCEVVTTGATGATSSTASCRGVPASCPSGASPCSCITGMSDGGNNSCASISIGGSRQTTVSFSR